MSDFVTTTLQQDCWENNLWRLHCLCDIFLTWDMFAFSLLFYGKYYVTMFIREYVAFSYRYWGKFLLKNEKKLSRIIFFHRKRRFLFCFLRSSNRFFLSVSFRFILYFFGRQWLDGFYWFCDLLFFIVMKRHNRFFWIGDFCFIPAGRSQTMGVVT